MELKSTYIELKEETSFSSNRTFMELKCRSKLEYSCTQISSNRTFMELKSGRHQGIAFVWYVLIVPLWN